MPRPSAMLKSTYKDAKIGVEWHKIRVSLDVGKIEAYLSPTNTFVLLRGSGTVRTQRPVLSIS